MDKMNKDNIVVKFYDRAYVSIIYKFLYINSHFEIYLSFRIDDDGLNNNNNIINKLNSRYTEMTNLIDLITSRLNINFSIEDGYKIINKKYDFFCACCDNLTFINKNIYYKFNYDDYDKIDNYLHNTFSHIYLPVGIKTKSAKC